MVNDSLISDISCMMQVIVRNVPPDPDESVSELVEHFFLVNHPDHYLTHQVSIVPQFNYYLKMPLIYLQSVHILY